MDNFFNDFIWIIIYGFIYTVSEKVSIRIGTPHIVTVLSMLLYWTGFYCFLYRKRNLKKYYICFPSNKKLSEYIIYVPLLFMPAVNLIIFCVNYEAVVIQSNGRNIHTLFELGWIWTISITICCAIGEEVFFRGILLSALIKKYKMKMLTGIIASSLFFACMHMANLYAGVTFRYALLQSFSAGAVGFCFAVVVCREQSVIPCIMVHSLINMTAFDSYLQEVNSNGIQKIDISDFQAVTSMVFTVVYLIYGIWLYREDKYKNRRKTYEIVH